MKAAIGKGVVVLGLGGAVCFAAAARGQDGGNPQAAVGGPATIGIGVYPARIEAAPGGLADPISLTVTNGGPLTTSISLTVEGVLGWPGTKAQTAELTPGGSTVMTIYLRSPGLAGPATDNILISAIGDGDNKLTGQATLVAARRACWGDWDGIGGLNERDVTAFLGDVFRQTADFDGVDGTTAWDLYQFLDAYFDGCG